MPPPSVLPTWAVNAPEPQDKLEPPQNEKNVGFVKGIKPQRQFVNWLFWNIGEWIAHFKETLDEFDGFLGNDLMPIGSWLIYNDYGNKVEPPNPDIYWPLNGSTINDPDSPLNGVTVEDMSNRTIVGFGDENGKDIISDVYNSNPVGNAHHRVNLQHSHTVDEHTHGPGNLVFETKSHKHTTGDHALTVSQMPSHKHDVYFYTGGGQVKSRITGNSGENGGLYTHNGAAKSTGEGKIHNHGDTNEVSVKTDSEKSSGSTDKSSPTLSTNSKLSTIQSIQMRSQRVRAYVRYK